MAGRIFFALWQKHDFEKKLLKIKINTKIKLFFSIPKTPVSTIFDDYITELIIEHTPLLNDNDLHYQTPCDNDS